MLAVLRRCDGDLGLQMLGKREVDNVDVVALDDLAPIGCGFLPAPLTSEVFGRLRIPAASDGHDRLELGLEERLDLSPGIRMGPAHELGPENGDADLAAHGMDPTSRCYWFRAILLFLRIFTSPKSGMSPRNFIDCGGTRRSSSACTLQTYVANDTDHRLPAKKLLRILEAAAVLTQADDIDVDFECQEATISIYSLDQASFDDANNHVVLSLAAKQTDCLAKDACGIDPDAKTVAIGAGSTSGLNLLGDDAPSGACCSIDSTGST